jgi:hypothetical protein
VQMKTIVFVRAALLVALSVPLAISSVRADTIGFWDSYMIGGSAVAVQSTPAGVRSHSTNWGKAFTSTLPLAPVRSLSSYFSLMSSGAFSHQTRVEDLLSSGIAEKLLVSLLTEATDTSRAANMTSADDGGSRINSDHGPVESTKQSAFLAEFASSNFLSSITSFASGMASTNSSGVLNASTGTTGSTGTTNAPQGANVTTESNPPLGTDVANSNSTAVISTALNTTSTGSSTTANTTSVPEPSSLLLLSSGLLALVATGCAYGVKRANVDLSTSFLRTEDPRVLREDIFRSIMDVEQRRVKRSRQSSLLMILNEVDYDAKSDAGSGLLRRVASSLASATRETDVVGWYDEHTLAVIFTETPVAATLGERLRAKVAATLSATYGPAAAEHLAISLHELSPDGRGFATAEPANGSGKPQSAHVDQKTCVPALAQA